MARLAALLVVTTLAVAPVQAGVMESVTGWLKAYGSGKTPQESPVPDIPEAGPVPAPEAEGLSPEAKAAMGRGDISEAMKILKRDAKAGNREAQFTLARLEYSKGHPGAAYELYVEAATAGHVEAAFMLGHWHAGYAQYEKAAYWWGKAAAAGNKEAQYELAQLHKNGHAPSASMDVATELYCRAAAQGHVTSARVVKELDAVCESGE